MTTTLTFSHEVTIKNRAGAFNQRMHITVDYNPDMDIADVKEILITQGASAWDVTELLHRVEGSPLDVMVSAIDWAEIYRDVNHLVYE